MRSRLEQHRKVSTVSGDLGEDTLQSLIGLGHYTKASVQARALANAPGAAACRRIEYLVREIECERRRAARDALEKAARRYRQVEEEGLACPDVAPRLYYEGGYVSLLRGYHRNAKAIFELSQAAAEQLTGHSLVAQYWLAADAVVECIVAIDGTQAPWRALFARADQAEEELRDVPNIHAGRCIDSWNWDRIRMALVEGNAESARRFLRRAEDYVHNQTALGGWNTSTLAKRLQLRGSVRLRTAESASDLRSAAETLTRALVVLVGRWRQYPEGVRDILYDLATAVELLGVDRQAHLPAHLRAVADETRDASSWSYPYRAD